MMLSSNYYFVFCVRVFFVSSGFNDCQCKGSCCFQIHLSIFLHKFFFPTAFNGLLLFTRNLFVSFFRGDSFTLLSTTLIWVVWQNEDENYDNFDLQSIHDKILEVVSITETWHLGKLQVGLSRAPRLAQGQSIKIQLLAAFPVQIDGEPWFQQSCTLAISHHGQAFMLKRAAVEPLGHAAAIITDVLENAETNSVINASQKRALLQEMALRP
ncbi:diacylglycerol kinase 1-like [Cannabis sativa]|uniref:diacylglycerol kinase 1-like n=1 Tax=Cannabis sativa TaxID=3483 RepID=UPI0029CA08D2|nr:diacylglycerol kinase 1-like [Cannabis sativa]